MSNNISDLKVYELIQKHFPDSKPKQEDKNYKLTYHSLLRNNCSINDLIEEEKEEQEEKYPESEEDELLLEEDIINKVIKLSIMTNNVDIERRKYNYQTLGKAEIKEDDLEKWKYECDKLTKLKKPCRRLIDKREDLMKTFKHINNKKDRKIFYKKFNYINSIIIKKYGYRNNK